MRAIVMSEYGGPDCLRPAEGWAIVRLKAAALNWHDVLVREGRYGSRLLCWG